MRIGEGENEAHIQLGITCSSLCICLLNVLGKEYFNVWFDHVLGSGSDAWEFLREKTLKWVVHTFLQCNHLRCSQVQSSRHPFSFFEYTSKVHGQLFGCGLSTLNCTPLPAYASLSGQDFGSSPRIWTFMPRHDSSFRAKPRPLTLTDLQITQTPWKVFES